MKSYDEIAKSVLERRDRHNETVAKRKRITVRVGVPVMSLCLAAMIGVGYSDYKDLTRPPELVDDAVVPGIDDTVDPGETEALGHKCDGDTVTDILDDEPVPGGAEIGTVPAIITDVNVDEPTEDKRQEETPEGGDAIWIEPKWAEKALYSKYPEFELGGTKYTTGAVWIDADKLGNAIGGTNAYGYDIYEDKSYEMGITVYEINGIDKNAAVAVSYNGFNGQYAVYYDVWYKPATLGEFMNALDLYENLTFGTIYYTTFEYESYMTVEYKISSSEVIFDLLKDNEAVANVAESVSDYDMSFYENAMSMSVNVDILGIHNVSLSVSENGYIQTNILGTRKLFYIGEDKAEEFFNYVKTNFETVREETLVATTTAVTSSVPEDIVVTAVTQTSPAYNPNAGVNE